MQILKGQAPHIYIQQNIYIEGNIQADQSSAHTNKTTQYLDHYLQPNVLMSKNQPISFKKYLPLTEYHKKTF